MKVFILTEDGRGMASRCLPALLSVRNVEVVGVIQVAPAPRRFARIIRKVAKIGLLGAINGVRMRSWYEDQDRPLELVCQELGVRFISGLRQNSAKLQQTILKLNADLGLSLGNGFISPKVFSIPKYGMLNVHSEILPQYQNAQSIIWPIYCNDPFTGFTIHEIDRKIDGGRIIFLKRMPILFYPTLGRTVRENRKRVESTIPMSLAMVCQNFEQYQLHAAAQVGGRSYTTPSIWSYWKMVCNNRKFYAQQN